MTADLWLGAQKS